MQRVHLERDQLWDGQFYLAGDRDVPDELAIALGLHTPESMTEQLISKISELANKPPPKDLETLPDEPEQQGQKSVDVSESFNPAALKLLNSATTEAELIPLPSVGEATAKALLAKRPELGYESLDQAEKIHSDKAHINWEAIALWEAEGE